MGREADVTWYRSVGSGLNFYRPELLALIEDILAGKFRGGFIVCTDFTRLARFGVRSLEKIAEFGGCQIVYTMDEREAKTTNETLANH